MQTGAMTGRPQVQDQLSRTFNELGIMQGAVLTYAPYIGILLADDQFTDDD